MNKPTDFNDVAKLQGAEAVRSAIDTAKPVDDGNSQGEQNAVAGTPCTNISLFAGEGKKKSQATILIEICNPLELFHDAESNGYAVIIKPSHSEVWPIQSRAFRNWLGHQYYKLTEQGARGQAIGDAVATIDAKAQHDSEQREVFMRVAWLADRIYIDLADEKWRVVEIDKTGWRVLDKSPVMFTRRAGMAALPDPVSGSLDNIDKLLNVEPADVTLVVGWLLMAARGRGPYPVLVLHGEQGSGKSTLTTILRNLIDPSTVPLRGLNKDIRDLLVTATNNHVLVLDNLSALTAEVSDAICRFAVGGGFAERQLYTNRDEIIVHVQRPIIMNGIDEVVSRGDLVERSIILRLPAISETKRTDETQNLRRYESMRPRLLGGLYTAMSCAIRKLPDIHLARKPRMADFVCWITAAEGALGWAPGEFLEAYRRNLDEGSERSLEASPFGEALVRLMDRRAIWSGTATDLLNELEHSVHERAIKSQSWPKSGKGASNALRRLTPLLRRVGVSINSAPRAGSDGRRMLEIIKTKKQPSVTSVPSVIQLDKSLRTDGTLTKQNPANRIVSASSVTSTCKQMDSDVTDVTADCFGDKQRVAMHTPTPEEIAEQAAAYKRQTEGW